MKYKDMTIEELRERASQVRAGSERAIINEEIISRLMEVLSNAKPAQ